MEGIDYPRVKYHLFVQISETSSGEYNSENYSLYCPRIHVKTLYLN